MLNKRFFVCGARFIVQTDNVQMAGNDVDTHEVTSHKRIDFCKVKKRMSVHWVNKAWQKERKREKKEKMKLSLDQNVSEPQIGTNWC